MKRLVITWLLLVLFAGLCVPVYASVTIEAVISERIDVVFDFRGINSTVYGLIKQHSYLFNDTTFPQIIVDNFEKLQNLTITYSPQDSHLEFNQSEPFPSMRATFYLSGSDILSFTYNKTSMGKTYRVRTDWRKFYANFTGPEGENILTLDFKTYFGEPLNTWSFTEEYLLNNENRSAYFFNNTDATPFDSLSMSFILPKRAIPRSPEGDTIVFEFPPAFWDVLLNSPIPIVGALIIVSISAVLYRKIRRRG